MSELKSDYRFKPIRGLEADLKNVPHTEGALLISTDTGKMWFDTPSYRISLGGGGSAGAGGTSIMYAHAPEKDQDLIDKTYSLSFDELDDPTIKPEEGTLIINEDGTFYKVVSVDSNKRTFKCYRIAVSGNGGGSSTSKTMPIDLEIEEMATSNLINGKPYEIAFVATSATKIDGSYVDKKLTISWSLAYTDNGGLTYTTYQTGKFQVDSGVREVFDVGSRARESSSLRLTMIASQQNSLDTVQRNIEFDTSDLALTKSSSFSNVNYFNGETVTLQCNAVGNMNKILDYYWDDMDTPIATIKVSDSANSNQTLSIKNYVSKITNGYHEVKIVLSQDINGQRGLSVDPLKFEVAYYDGSSKDPIIWLGDYQTQYYEYDNIQIPYRVFDPNSQDSVTVHLYKDNIEMASSPRTITDNTAFSSFEITDADLGVQNYYTIACGETRRDIFFTLVADSSRPDFKVQKDQFLVMGFDSRGRSNSESETNREIVYDALRTTGIDRDKIALETKFTNFNWYNNGWITDKTTGTTCLRISNGASFGIKLGSTTFKGSNANETSHTFEFQFKVRNVQDYASLIHNVTRYKNDTDLYNAFYDSTKHEYKTKYTNYDSFLAWYLKENYVPYVDVKANETRALTYDDLDFNFIEKQINLNAVACGYYSGSSSSPTGICLGPQDAFFSNGTNTVNVSYVEDEMINLTAVFNHTNELMYIYINGVLTGIIKSTAGTFTIEPEDGMLMFNSNYCDIDLYKIRVYDTSLTVNDVIMNYAFDLKNIDTYDQNKLATENTAINEFQLKYDNMIDYNNKHASAPLMPYIIFDTSKSGNDDKLSYSKKTNVVIGVEFVNTGLERAYNNGELEALAKADGLFSDNATDEEKQAAVKNYYMHHCPSWIGENINMAVQGTSSEFYPRRNYKLKTKTTYDSIDDTDATNEATAMGNPRTEKKSYVHMMMNRGPFAEDYANDIAGYSEKEFILSDQPFKEGTQYYLDAAGKQKAAITISDYQANKYYIKNSAYRKFGKENTRLKYFYYNNYTAGTTKFTMKIDFMESSGSYNMGLANLVGSAYSKHPLDDYNKGALDTMKTTYVEVGAEDVFSTDLDYFLDAKGDQQVFFYKNIANYQNDEGQPVDTIQDVTGSYTFGTTKLYYKKSEPNVATYTIPNTSDYRTSVQGFRVMAFHKKSDGTYQYIGLYNMLLDKGADEAYGFKADKTTGETIIQKFAKNKKLPAIAECWEFENNNRTFCSFRDPLNRKELSFDVVENGKRKLNSVGSAPVVADSFEQRYHNKADVLDYIVDPVSSADKLTAALDEYPAWGDYDIAETSDAAKKAQVLEDRAKILLKLFSNWEKAVKWVWSTNTEVVPSQGEYTEVEDIGTAVWQKGIYFVDKVNEDGSHSFVIDDGDAFVKDQAYYTQVVGENEKTEYTKAYLVASKDHVYEPDTYYIKQKDASYALSSDAFDEAATYYTMTNYSAEELDQKADILVKKAGEYNADTEYYSYNPDAICDATKPTATKKLGKLSQEEFKTLDSKVYVASPVKLGKTTFTHDTQEYRAAKFVNELADHFDIEYLATYFVVTEVLECYDSRGKNCMMASWGPQKQGGDYIWYPIFYDMDTQLGINNTGIPSFEYNVDATDDGNFSTSDSLLWNNFYKYFKNSKILEKYKHLRGTTAGVSWTKLSNPPFVSVDKIESWYSTDPVVCNSLAMRGERPLVATNLDEYYKYITITNGLGVNGKGDATDGITGAINNTGGYETDNGTYFYALQGDRSLSRRQFLTNRLEYIDSWLNQGNYQRGGANRIRGRVAANNDTKTSDAWIADSQNPYFDKDGNKSHLFDAEYWLNLTPMRSSYVTISDDNEAYPSKKYDGINPVKFEISAIEKGVTESKNYPEQLLYVYGLNQMKDLGDMSNLYWQEFEISGNASKLSSLKLGYDGLMTDSNGNLVEATTTGKNTVRVGDKTYYKWFNDHVNEPSIPAGKTKSGMPLLKEVNFSNIQISTGTPTLDLTSCEKLQNFRATGSNLTQVQFAEGVALHTLYLPVSITSLELTEARLLTNLITEYEYPVRNNEGNLVAKPGLFFEGMFDSNKTSIATLSLLGGSLGYDSLKLLNKYFEIRNQQSAKSAIAMTDVKWTPYQLLVEGDQFDAQNEYYVDDGHFGLKRLYATVDQAPESEKATADIYDAHDWDVRVLNGEIYKLNKDIPQEAINQMTDVTMLETMASSSKFVSTAAQNNSVPNITGTVFIANQQYTLVGATDNRNSVRNTYFVKSGNAYTKLTDESQFESLRDAGSLYYTIRETYIRNSLNTNYPNIKFFFNHVDQAYTAKFMILEDDGTYQLIGTETIDSGWFKNPIDTYGDITDKKANYDFYGWSDVNKPVTDAGANILVNLDKSVNKWDEGKLTVGVHDYIFYAIFSIHSWNNRFHDYIHNEPFVKSIPAGEVIVAPAKSEFVPGRSDADIEEDTQTYRFAGWSLSKEGTIIDVSTYRSTKDRDFYAVFTKVSVYDNATDESFFKFQDTTYESNYGVEKNKKGWSVSLADGVAKADLIGKITIPSFYNGTPVVKVASNGFAGCSNLTHVFFLSDSEVRSIDGYGFSQCTALKKIYLPQTLEFIGQRAFQYDTSLEIMNFDLPNLEFIDAGAFRQCFNASITDDLFLSGNIRHLGTQVISSPQCTIKEIVIGSKEHPSQLYNGGDWPTVELDSNNKLRDVIFFSGESKILKVTIYCSAEDHAYFQKLSTLTNKSGTVALGTTEVNIVDV